MKKILLVSMLVLALAGAGGCTNMNNTSQGAMSGAVLGGAAGLGIAAISGGALGWGTLAGAGAGALAGAIVGNQRDF